MRIGMGYDVHRLVEGRRLILCGVEIPHHLGLLGHSDADVALHALSDALLGAAALRDIGYHFPDTDPRYKGADSRMLLRETARIIREQRNLHPVNVDVTIIAQAPKLLPHIPQMIQNIANGRLNKFFKESCLMEQEYVQDSKLSVGQFLEQTQKGLVAVAFKRVNLNED